mgnify:CR=1 FL=1
MKLLRYLLFPIVPIYFLVSWAINLMYDLGLKQSKSYNLPIICVGNLSVGGTGKSPMIEYLIRLLQSDYNLATLSRGYKRETKGFKLADESDSAKTIGDEPFQFYNKFKNQIKVAVDANRQEGIAELLALKNKPNVILLDDAFQHRKVKAGLNVLLTTYNNLYCKDIVLPTGNLREPRSGAKRAQIIVVTKCPESITEKQKQTIKAKLNLAAKQQVFFSSISYSENVFSINKTLNVLELKKFTLVTGIANASPLVEFLKMKDLEFNHLNFKDHHIFSKTELENLAKLDCIVTTEKDFMRLKSVRVLQDKLFYLPIEVLIDNKDLFDKIILNFVSN